MEKVHWLLTFEVVWNVIDHWYVKIVLILAVHWPSPAKRAQSQKDKNGLHLHILVGKQRLSVALPSLPKKLCTQLTGKAGSESRCRRRQAEKSLRSSDNVERRYAVFQLRSSTNDTLQNCILAI